MRIGRIIKESGIQNDRERDDTRVGRFKGADIIHNTPEKIEISDREIRL